MVEVRVKNGDIDGALRALKKKGLKEGLLKKFKEQQVYKKPSEKRQEKEQKRLKRIRNNEARLRKLGLRP